MHDVMQQALGELSPRRHMDRGIRCTVGCNSPRVDEDIVEHQDTILSADKASRELSVEPRRRECCL